MPYSNIQVASLHMWNKQGDWSKESITNLLNKKTKTIRQKYVHKQSKMESQRNAAYIKNRKKTQ